MTFAGFSAGTFHSAASLGIGADTEELVGLSIVDVVVADPHRCLERGPLDNAEEVTGEIRGR